MIARRSLLVAAAGSLLPALARAGETYDACVGVIPGGMKAGKAFPSLMAALAAAPATDAPWRILLGQADLFEKVTIARANTSITGLAPELSRITFDDYSGRSDGAGATLGTRRSGTLTITAPNVRLANLSLINSFDYRAQQALPATDPTKVKDTQALALAISGNADRVRLDKVTLSGFQDTLFIDSGRALLRDCHVSGCVDFIFGAATVALQSCRITSRLVPGRPNQGYVCAPSTLKTSPYGFVFFDCVLDHDGGEPFPDDSVALARPWRPTTTFPDGRYGNPDVSSACLYLRCQFGGHITRKGWDHMGYNAKDGSRAFTEPEDARFFIAQCSGPAAETMPASFIAPPALYTGLTPDNLLGLNGWV